MPSADRYEISPPERLSIPTCTGCGAISRWGTCDTGCREQRLDLVRADQVQWLGELMERSHARTDHLRAALERVAGAPAPTIPARWVQLRRAAADALGTCPDVDAADPAWDEPPERVTVWRCDACGGVDAPQECLGICTWRPIEWATIAAYERARAQAHDQHATEARLRTLLRKIAHVRPKPEREAETGRALQGEARSLLGGGHTAAGPR